MNWLIVTPEQKAELDAINDVHPFQKCSPVETAEGVMLTTSDKIGSEYWADWQNWLLSLTLFHGQPIWPNSPVEVETTTP
jgi:hypothetical protein